MNRQTTQTALTTIALVGTTQHGTTPIKTETAIDTLMSQLPTLERERTLLLAAGSVAMYQQAGYLGKQISLQQEAAPAETLLVCSPRIASLIEKLLAHQNRPLLPEALQRLHQVGQRLPYDLLPRVLDLKEAEVQKALLTVIGERGHWLSHFNPEWAWVADALHEEGDTLPANAETLWQEGTLTQRTELLRRLRLVNAVQAREWVQQVWKQEKAEARAKLLQTSTVTLSAADEAFLEQALDDRAQDVRTTATHLLSLLPTSAFMQRARQRAENVLQFSSNTLIVTPPQRFEQAWQRDGMFAGPVKDMGERAYWLMQILSLIPPDDWEQRFHTSPATVIAAADSSQWKEAVIQGWFIAALLHNASAWIRPLWQWWYKNLPLQKATLSDLLAHMTQAEAEESVLELSDSDEEWSSFLPSLPRPWSISFSLACIQRLREHFNTLPTNQIPNYQYAQALSTILVAIPHACFEAALAPWGIDKNAQNNWYTNYWEKQLDNFLDMLQLRKRIIEEIAR